MDYSSLFDLPSLLFVLSSVIIGFIASLHDRDQALALGSDLAIPVGVCGSLLGFAMMLSSLEDPSALGGAMSITLLPMIYGVVLSALLGALAESSLFSEADKTAHSNAQLFEPRTLVSCALLLLLSPALLVINGRDVMLMISGPAGLTVVLGLALSMIAGSDAKAKVMATSRYALYIAAALILCSVSSQISAWGDPKSIGPVMALGILSLLYASVVHACAQVVYRVSSGEALPQTPLKNVALSVSALLVLISSYLVIVHIPG